MCNNQKNDDNTSFNELLELLLSKNDIHSLNATQENSLQYDKRVQTLETLMPLMSKKSQKEISIIIAAIKITNIISGLKEKNRNFN